MNYSNFKIGTEFVCGDKRRRCTYVGSRVIVAICLSDHEDISWYNGPPYSVVEIGSMNMALRL
jgi:hypothetical protein